MDVTAMVSPSTSTSSSVQIEFQLSYRGQTFSCSLDCHSLLETLSDVIYDQTGVLPIHQKIVAPGVLRKVFATVEDWNEEKRTLEQLGFQDEYVRRNAPIKLMLVGPREEEVAAVRREDERGAKMNAPRTYHPSMVRGAKARSTAIESTSSTNPFLSLRVHPNTPTSAPEYDLVMSRLRRLSTDEAVVHVCQLHNFRVGELTELLPHEHPHLLGLNENMGQRISLRLRTDRYDGLQPYRDTRRVLLHELAHNKVNDHPPAFKILNSELNAQVEAFEQAKKRGTHSLMGDMDVYVPPAEQASEQAPVQTAFVLGGAKSASLSGTDVQNRRQRVLEATMKRLEKVEESIERGCGSGPSTSEQQTSL